MLNSKVNRFRSSAPLAFLCALLLAATAPAFAGTDVRTPDKNAADSPGVRLEADNLAVVELQNPGVGDLAVTGASEAVSILRTTRAPFLPLQASPLNGLSTDPDGPHRAELLGKRPVDAFWRSAILPGWGQRYSGRNARGTFYTAVDALLWTGLIWSQQGWKMGESTYHDFAGQHASISGGHNHQFYVDIGNFDNRDEFNDFRRQQRDYEGQYTGSDSWWEWDDEGNRLTFKNLRIVADRHKNRVYYIAGGLLLNRIISAIDAGRGLSTIQQRMRESTGLSLEFDTNVGGPSLVWRGTFGWR